MAVLPNQVAEVSELRGTTTRQDGEVRQLRAQNQELGQKAALVAVLTAEAAALKAQVRSEQFFFARTQRDLVIELVPVGSLSHLHDASARCWRWLHRRIRIFPTMMCVHDMKVGICTPVQPPTLVC